MSDSFCTFDTPALPAYPLRRSLRAFVCNECGADYPRWQGQCSACHAWNTITEVRLAASPTVARN
ncbi:hypothetical protein ONJ95_27210, partial [Salmonella enterica subsp. enterica serovar Virginia]|nr:hypothetical protein [Salmonella enterica subsp. enterica serovar Virginia]